MMLRVALVLLLLGCVALVGAVLGHVIMYLSPENDVKPPAAVSGVG